MRTAALFDLDDTLADRDAALGRMIDIITSEFYDGRSFTMEPPDTDKPDLLPGFKAILALKSYDNRGYSDKARVLNAFFDRCPPKRRPADSALTAFWDENFPGCFLPCEDTLAFISEIKRYAVIAVITNGSSAVQRAKLKSSGLDRLIETVIISDEVGVSKPDRRIFELAIERLNAKPENAFFVGDNLEKDIAGASGAGIRGVWFNPRGEINGSAIEPFAEIRSLRELFRLFPFW